MKILNDEKSSLLYLTDTGYINRKYYELCRTKSIYVIESNHDEKMLMANPKYSLSLKQRIKGNNGHLSNIVCAKVVSRLAVNNVRQVVLAHLSEENNTPDLCYKTVSEYLSSVGVTPEVNIKIFVASPKAIGPIFHITG